MRLYRADPQAGEHDRQDVPEHLGTPPSTLLDALPLLLEWLGLRSILAGWQLPDGGFNIYVDGPSEISASVKAYFALKVAGIPASRPPIHA